MRYLTLFSILVTLNAWSAERPQNGLYRCVKGNNSSVCEQQLRFNGDELRVMYEGECGGQGPYYHYCDETSCSNGAIEFTFQDATHYRWENSGYSIFCEMEKI